MTDPIKFFTERFNITIAEIESLLARRSRKAGDYADLVFRVHGQQLALTIEEQISSKNRQRTVEQGVGVRVISGERTGYATATRLPPDAIRKAALSAAHIADSGGCNGPVTRLGRASRNTISIPVRAHPAGEEPLERKIELLRRADQLRVPGCAHPRGAGDRFWTNSKSCCIATSEGLLIGDVQPLTRLNVMCYRG
jgi:TldD protein